jgi:hypothetical protein
VGDDTVFRGSSAEREERSGKEEACKVAWV